MRIIFSILAVLVISGCVAPSKDVDTYLYLTNIRSVELDAFDICHAYGCQRQQRVHTDKAFWNSIDAVFTPSATSGAEERTQIAEAIGVFERYVGPLTGTDTDTHGTYYEYGEDQMDCVDESTNTTVYLKLLDKQGHLKFNEITSVEARSPVKTGRWWHQTATVRDLATGERFAIDSWFENNGHPAYVVPYEIWDTGWKPANPEWQKQAGGNSEQQ